MQMYSVEFCRMNVIELNVLFVTCLCGAVLAPLTLKQEVVDWRLTLLTIFYYINSVQFYRISLGKTRLSQNCTAKCHFGKVFR